MRRDEYAVWKMIDDIIAVISKESNEEIASNKAMPRIEYARISDSKLIQRKFPLDMYLLQTVTEQTFKCIICEIIDVLREKSQ